MDIGDAIAAASALVGLAALWVAVRTLVHAERTAEQSREDYRRERRLDRQEDLVLDISDRLENLIGGNGSAVMSMTARLRALPPSMLPMLRAVLDLPTQQLVAERVTELIEEAQGRGVFVRSGPQNRAAVLATDLRDEISRLLDHLDKSRP